MIIGIYPRTQYTTTNHGPPLLHTLCYSEFVPLRVKLRKRSLDLPTGGGLKRPPKHLIVNYSLIGAPPKSVVAKLFVPFHMLSAPHTFPLSPLEEVASPAHIHPEPEKETLNLNPKVGPLRS